VERRDNAKGRAHAGLPSLLRLDDGPPVSLSAAAQRADRAMAPPGDFDRGLLCPRSVAMVEPVCAISSSQNSDTENITLRQAAPAAVDRPV
jgi:hypothetical protein